MAIVSLLYAAFGYLTLLRAILWGMLFFGGSVVFPNMDAGGNVAPLRARAQHASVGGSRSALVDLRRLAASAASLVERWRAPAVGAFCALLRCLDADPARRISYEPLGFVRERWGDGCGAVGRSR